MLLIFILEYVYDSVNTLYQNLSISGSRYLCRLLWSGIRESATTRTSPSLSAVAAPPHGNSLLTVASFRHPIPDTSKTICLLIPVNKTNPVLGVCFIMERDTGIGPVSQPWEGRVLPLYKSRN